MHIILLAGYTTHPTEHDAQHGSLSAGKTTIAKRMCEALTHARKYSFATLLREQARSAWPTIDWDCKQPGNVVGNLCYREIMERLGGAYRAIDKYVYARSVMQRLEPGVGFAFIDDCRFVSEFEFVRNYAQSYGWLFTPIMLHRNATVRDSTTERDVHALYAQFYHVDNNRAIDDACRDVHTAMLKQERKP